MLRICVAVCNLNKAFIETVIRFPICTVCLYFRVDKLIGVVGNTTFIIHTYGGE